MKVSPSKEMRNIVFVLFLVVLLSALIVYSCDSLIGAILIVILGGSLVLRYWLAFGKTITFYPEGISLKFLWIIRFLKWEEMKTKRPFDCTNSYGYKAQYFIGAEFSKSECKRPHWLMPAEYAVIFRPWAYIFVCFSSTETTGKKVEYPIPYEVDRSIFCKMMTERKGRGDFSKNELKTGDGSLS